MEFSQDIPDGASVIVFESREKLNLEINKIFGCFDFIDTLHDHVGYLRDIAENFKVKLMFEGYEYCSFSTVVAGNEVSVFCKLEIDQ